MAMTEILPRKKGTVIINGRVCPFTAPDPEIMKQITGIIQSEIDRNGGKYPEDTWVEFGINGRFDLNIWTDDETGERKAAVYRTKKKGKHRTTDTSEWEKIASGYIPQT